MNKLRTALALTATLLAAGTALADNIAMPAKPSAASTQECASCHTAYAPGLLPASSWKRIMATLDKHYGTDASLDDKAVAEISGWLAANAGTYKRATATPDDRITSAAWFVREHRKVDATVWKLASVNSASNCAACHGGADQGRFNERELIFPPGLDARYRRAWRD